LFVATCSARYYDDSHQHYDNSPQYYEKPVYEPAPSPVNGVPVDTAEVQHAKAHHFALVSAAQANLGASGHGQNYQEPKYNQAPAHYAPAPAYKHTQAQYVPSPAHYAPAPVHYSAPAPVHYTAPVKAYYNPNPKAFEPAPAPVNGVPVDTAEVKHAKAIHFALYSEAQSHSGYNGAPDDTYEVQAEKANHFALVAQAASQKGYSNQPEDDGSYDPRKYENEYHH
jgi:hypothetical protein